jgi:hypothetical protein
VKIAGGALLSTPQGVREAHASATPRVRSKLVPSLRDLRSRNDGGASRLDQIVDQGCSKTERAGAM